MISPDDTDSEWQRIWFSIRPQGCTSLALVPSFAGIDVIGLAETLAMTARRQGERPVSVVNGTSTHLDNVQEVIDSISQGTERGELVIVPVNTIVDNPSAIALVQATSAALMVVRLGETLIASAQTALDAVGREKFIGSVIVDGSSVKLR